MGQEEVRNASLEFGEDSGQDFFIFFIFYFREGEGGGEWAERERM